MVHTVKDKQCRIDGLQCLYTGEADLLDNPCGFGTAIHPDVTHEGTFLDGEQHGFGMLLCMQDRAFYIYFIVVLTYSDGDIIESEVKNGTYFGKGTFD